MAPLAGALRRHLVGTVSITEMAAKVETGVQLLARLGARPSLSSLEPAFFGNEGPKQSSLVEFVGEEGTGKTQAVQHLVANAILPSAWRGIELKGQGVGVILIDTDYHFCLLRLSSILENRINYSFGAQKEGSGSSKPAPEGDVEALIKECMRRLFIVRCNSTTQLIMSLYSLESLLSSKLDIAMLIIDSASAFYWMDRGVTSDSTSAKNSPQQRTLAALQHIIKTYGLFTVITRAAIFAAKSKDDTDSKEAQFSRQSSEQWNYLGKQWQQAVCCSYTFSAACSSDGSSVFTVGFSPSGSQSAVKRHFYVTDYGLQFSTS